MKFRSKTFICFVVLAAIYASVNLLAAPPRTTLERYHISGNSLRLLDTTVVIPVIAIWFVGVYGYQKLQRYAGLVQDNTDGQQVLLLTRGLMLLAFWLPVTSTLSALLNFVGTHHQGLVPAITITVNYLTLAFPLVAFLYINKGSRGLSELSKQRPSRIGIHIMAFVLIAAGVFYGYLIANAHASLANVYHLPTAAILLSIVVPYIFTWYLGLLSAFDLHVYTQKVSGVIYRKSWNSLALGFGWIILFSIFLQYLTAVSAKLNNLSLGWILSLVYTLLPIMAVGYVLVAIGAKRLTKIEEV